MTRKSGCIDVTPPHLYPHPQEPMSIPRVAAQHLGTSPLLRSFRFAAAGTYPQIQALLGMSTQVTVLLRAWGRPALGPSAVASGGQAAAGCRERKLDPGSELSDRVRATPLGACCPICNGKDVTWLPESRGGEWVRRSWSWAGGAPGLEVLTKHQGPALLGHSPEP